MMESVWYGVLFALGVGGLVALIAWVVHTTPEEKAQAARDEVEGWEYVSNSRYGQAMYLCPICGALTVDKWKERHFAWHRKAEEVSSEIVNWAADAASKTRERV